MWLTIYDIRLVTLGDYGIQLLRQLKRDLYVHSIRRV